MKSNKTSINLQAYKGMTKEEFLKETQSLNIDHDRVWKEIEKEKGKITVDDFADAIDDGRRLGTIDALKDITKDLENDTQSNQTAGIESKKVGGSEKTDAGTVRKQRVSKANHGPEHE
jgi:hypothetical protein